MVPILRYMFIKNGMLFVFSDHIVAWITRLVSLAFGALILLSSFLADGAPPFLMNLVYEPPIKSDKTHIVFVLARVLEIFFASGAIGLIVKEKKRLNEDYRKDRRNAFLMALFLLYLIGAYLIVAVASGRTQIICQVHIN